MRFSQTLLPTLKEIPADVDMNSISHILLVRAGMIRRFTNGLYAWLPLYNRVMEKVKKVIREELEKIGCFEVLFPVLAGKEMFTESGRWDKFGGEMFRLKDRTEHEMCLSPTNEESACALARAYLTSYTQLPFCMYQIQKKYRDEIRPRGGLMRAREFTMKDAYSFHLNDADLHSYYLAVKRAYCNIFERLGVFAVPVAADNGAMGGNASEEFMVKSTAGSDTIGVCKCGKAYNAETLGGKTVCPHCKKKLEFSAAFEIGHIFELGNYYTDKLGITVATPANPTAPLTMGCYGIGLDRTISAIIEQHNDVNGIVFPEIVAPFKVNLIIVNKQNDGQVKMAENLYRELLDNNAEVIYDDRDVSVGIKFKDSDLIGIPYKIVVGKLADRGEVELISRDGKIKKVINYKAVLNEIR
jgi:prolyl-tRNA synthetase